MFIFVCNCLVWYVIVCLLELTIDELMMGELMVLPGRSRLVLYILYY